MAGRIFISYRRSESSKDARALYERLSRHFGQGQVFIDLEGIAPGDDFEATLARQLADCVVLLALIGRDWASTADAHGRRRLDDGADFVRAELRGALARGILVIPVLVDGATMPAAADLPEDLRSLSRRQAISLDFSRFDGDAGRLVTVIQKSLTGLGETVSGNAAPASASRVGAKQWVAAAGVTAAGIAIGGWAWYTGSRVDGAPPVTVSAAGAGSATPASAPDNKTRPARPGSSPGSVQANTTPLKRWRDCAEPACPWLVTLPAGRFTMGELPEQAGTEPTAVPPHEVTVARPFAIMEAELSRGQFRAFVEASRHVTGVGCNARAERDKRDKGDKGPDWRNPGYPQTDEHPVVCINWYDAQAYARWLSAKTGQRYRLASEAEWEYAARAGSPEPSGIGPAGTALCAVANVHDRTAAEAPDPAASTPAAIAREVADCRDGHVHTAPSRSLKANAWGLYDLFGNAGEWVQDCMVDFDYRRAPTDGSSVDGAACTNAVYRVWRGGTWYTPPFFVRAARRNTMDPSYRSTRVGVRLVRELP